MCIRDSIYEGKDEFEIKFGCFGGDGGDNGGSKAPDTTPTKGPNDGFRGEQSAASPSNKGYSGPSGAGIGPDATTGTSGQSSMDSFSGDADSRVSQANQNIADAIQASIAANQAVNNPMNMSINDMFSPTVTNPTQATQAALTTAPAQANTIATGFQSAQNAITSDLVCHLYTSPSPRDGLLSRMPSSA